MKLEPWDQICEGESLHLETVFRLSLSFSFHGWTPGHAGTSRPGGSEGPERQEDSYEWINLSAY